MKKFAIVAALLVAMVILVRLTREVPPPEPTRIAGPIMGTTFEIKIVSQPPLGSQQQERAQQAALDAMAGVNQRMSTYLDNSEISLFSSSRTTEPFKVSEDTLEVLNLSLEVASRSQGAFDITVGPLVELWGFGRPRPNFEVPAQERVHELVQEIGWQKLETNQVARTVRKRNPELGLNLSAIAKGYAADRVRDALLNLGLDNVMVEIGGEVATEGSGPSGEGWRLGIERPAAEGGLYRILELRGRSALATSGEYRNFYEVDGKRYSHTLDPRTGYPIDHQLASVSVVADDCATADAWATALNVLGPEKGLEIAARENVSALFLVYNQGGSLDEIRSPAFDRRFP